MCGHARIHLCVYVGVCVCVNLGIPRRRTEFLVWVNKGIIYRTTG